MFRESILPGKPVMIWRMEARHDMRCALLDSWEGIDLENKKQVEDQTMPPGCITIRRLYVKSIVFILLLSANLALADARQIDEYQWEGVERIVAIGDLHGDFENYLATLRAAGLIDKKDKWSGGKTHLVQTGDIPDRGPDTEKIIEHISKLEKQAARKGGRVHSLIGNHEAMNVYGDLRYVHEGEFKAFVTRNSAALRDRYFELSMQNMEANDPERFAMLPEDFRDRWNVQHPLGWVEHRQAWNPAWNPEGKYANWVLSRKVAIRINDLIFLHGGISGYYCQNPLDSITEKVVAELRHYNPQDSGMLEDEFGPLWYRGLSGVEPQALDETVDAILAHHKIKHIVVGHTPTNGVIWPRYDARVLMIDTGIASVYGGHIGYLEITPEGLFAGYPNGKLALPSGEQDKIAYLEKVIELDPGNPYLQERMELLRRPRVPEPAEPVGVSGAGIASDGGEPTSGGEPAPPPIPICGISI